jgi:hypothetical protein
MTGFLAWLEDFYVFFWLFSLARNFRRGISGKRVCSSDGVGRFDIKGGLLLKGIIRECMTIL